MVVLCAACPPPGRLRGGRVALSQHPIPRFFTLYSISYLFLVYIVTCIFCVLFPHIFFALVNRFISLSGIDGLV